MRYAIILAALVGCAESPESPPGGDPFDTAGPTSEYGFENLLVLSLDTLRRDRVGRYDGSGRTPTLDGLLAEGWALDDHRSCSNFTAQSMACAVSGRDPTAMGYVPATLVEEMPRDAPLLTQILEDAGFTNALSASNPFLADTSGYTRGFEPDLVYDGVRHANADASEVVERGLLLFDELEAQGGPWSLQLHFFDPHTPYAPSEAYLDALDELDPIPYDLSENNGFKAIVQDWNRLSAEERALIQEHLRVRYDGSIQYLDDQLGLLLEALDARGGLDDTLVVVFSDHGEQFADHGAFEHGDSLHAEETGAIAGFWGADGALGGQPWDAPTTHADVAPTVLDLLGIDSQAAFDGAPIDQVSDDRVRFSVRRIQEPPDDTTLAVDRDGLRLLYRWSGEIALYDARADPREEEDLSAALPEETAALWDLLAPRVDALYALYPDRPPVDPAR